MNNDIEHWSPRVTLASATVASVEVIFATFGALASRLRSIAGGR